MKRALLAWVLLVLPAVLTEPCFGLGQDVLVQRKIQGLKGLHTLAIVVRHNAPREFVTPREWGDMVETGLHSDVPQLKLSDPQHAPAWLEVNVITTDTGSFLELSVQRWTRLVESGEDTFSKVWWDSEMEIGHISKSGLQESLNALLRSFAADYFRAQQ